MADEALLPCADLGPCPYLPDREFRAELVPEFALDAGNPQQVGVLLEQGFRRNGCHWYRPRCHGCQACVPLRLKAKRVPAPPRPATLRQAQWRPGGDLARAGL